MLLLDAHPAIFWGLEYDSLDLHDLHEDFFSVAKQAGVRSTNFFETISERGFGIPLGIVSGSDRS